MEVARQSGCILWVGWSFVSTVRHDTLFGEVDSWRSRKARKGIGAVESNTESAAARKLSTKNLGNQLFCESSKRELPKFTNACTTTQGLVRRAAANARRAPPAAPNTRPAAKDEVLKRANSDSVNEFPPLVAVTPATSIKVPSDSRITGVTSSTAAGGMPPRI